MDRRPIAYVLLSAFLFGISTPLAKLLLADFSPVALAGLLYLGAFLGLAIYEIVVRTRGASRSDPLTAGDVPWLAGAVLFGGIVAPIALMTGLQTTTGFAASLLINLESVFTAIIGVYIFKEYGGRFLWIALIFMTVAGTMLAFEPSSGAFNLIGPALIVLAMLCWGLDNNLTTHISSRSAAQIALIKGLIAGLTSLSLAFVLGMRLELSVALLLTLLLGALSYGLSLVLFIKALSKMGSSRTSTFYSVAPFFGALLSIIILDEQLQLLMIPAMGLMALGAWVLLREKHSHAHRHPRLMHTHLHSHGEDHGHTHLSGGGTHAHEHVHEEVTHTHEHWPDQEHRHKH